MNIQIPKLMDMHCHFRYGWMANTVVPYHNRLCHAAIVMPNVPAILTSSDVCAYKQELEKSADFKPLMTIQITNKTTPELIQAANTIVGCKIYPKGQTTASQHGLSKEDLINPPSNLLYSYKKMEELGLVLQIHAEMPGAFCLYKEREFLPIVHELTLLFPKLKIVLEHVSSKEGIEFVKSHETVAATITPQHLIYTLDDLLGFDAHKLCMPIYKLPEDRRAIIDACVSGFPRFFAGTDSAPHTAQSKNDSHCAGVFVPPHISLPMYASIFDEYNCLHLLEDFTSTYGCQWYSLDKPKDKIVLKKEKWKVPNVYSGIVPLMYNQILEWKCESN